MRRMAVLLAALAAGAAHGPVAALEAELLRRALAEACAAPLGPVPALSGARWIAAANDQQRNELLTFELLAGGRLEIRREQHDGRLRGLLVEHWDARGRPVALVQGGPDCAPRGGRAVIEAGAERYLVDLDAALAPVGEPLPINPPPPLGGPAGEPGEAVRIALVDTGVDYRADWLVPHLAFDREGRLLGLDVVDSDDRPFDLDATRSAFFPGRHGTLVASVLVEAAPEARILPYRFAPGRPEGLALIAEHASWQGARVVAMALGSGALEDWREFARVAAAHPELLFVVSAGNHARDIDRAPVWPASFALANQLTVGSAHRDGRIAPDSNWGARTVDLLAHGEGVVVRDGAGRLRPGFGTSFAVPRIAALAARLAAREPGLDGAALKARLVARARPLPPHPQGLVLARHGWIPEPDRP